MMNTFLHSSHCRRRRTLASVFPFLRTPKPQSARFAGGACIQFFSQGAASVQADGISSSYGLPKAGRVPQVPYGFRELGIRDAIAKAISDAFPDVQRPTIAQADFIPAILSGKDVLLHDDTGTGKSFGSIVALLNKPRSRSHGRHRGGPFITSLVIVPHRDLGYQIMHWIEVILRRSGPNQPPADAIAQLVARSDSIQMEEQTHKLRSTPPHILIGTPQALWEIHGSDRGALQLEDVSTVVVDEVDYLLDVPSPYVRRSRESAAWRNFKKHPSLTRQLLEALLPARKPGAVPLADIDYNDDGNGDVRRNNHKHANASTGRPLQLVMSSATVHSNLIDYLCDARWLGEDKAIFSGKELLKANAHMLSHENLSKSGILHHAFMVSPDGKLRNVEFATRPGEDNENEDEGEEDEPTDSREKLQKIQSIPPQSPTSSMVMEAIASVFAVDVPHLALLVLPTSSSVKKVIAELEDLGVNARPLDLRAREIDRLGGAVSQSDEEPVLLVATPATIRGVDLPQLTHVFCAGAPDTASADVFKHVSGRVGRFGREGKVMTFVTERETERQDGVARTTKNPAGLLKTFYRRLRIKPVCWSWSPLFAIWTLLAFVQFGLVTAQSTSSNSSSASSATSASVSVTTGNVTSTFTTTSNSQTSTGVTIIQVTSTLTPSATTGDNATASETASASASASASAGPSLDTKIDPGFGVLGAILIITGLPSAFWGHKNRWSSFFLIGFYTFALSCFALILKFGVLEAISSPDAELRGVFVLACSIAGIIGGAVAIFFWQQAKYFIGAWGGFALGLWIQTFREGGLIRPIGYRWILYIGLAVAGFCLCTLPKIHYHVLLASTAAVGASAFVLGIDCYTTANLKEFYVANLGFNSLFTKFEDNGMQFPISQLMQIEIGLIAAFTLMGAAVQLRILKVLQRKLKEIAMEQKKRDEDLENQAAARFTLTAKELAEWEKEHGRADSHFSGLPLLKHQDAQSPNTEEGSTLIMDGQRRSRCQSGVSEFMVASGPADDRQSSGALPAIDLGGDLESDLAKDFDTERSNSVSSKGLSPQEREDVKKKEDLMAEITNIRKSIEQLRASTPGSSAEGGSHSRNPSFTSRRTLSLGLAEALDGPSRPPRATDPRARVHSMDRLSMSPDAFAAGASINRPSSVPLHDDTNWNEYVRERKLFQPPSGVSVPIAPSPVAPIAQRAPVPVPDAVAEALARRRQQEAAFDAGEFGRESQHVRSASHNMLGERPSSTMWSSQPKAAITNSKLPVTILPPKKPEPGQQSRPPAPRVHTFEELNERHREKMRDLQAPLSQAEQEQARLAEARSRWERSKEVEKQIMEKKLAEKEAALKQRQEEKMKKQGEGYQRSLSADKLNKLPGALTSSSKRQSMMKVEDWRRYQQEVGTSPARSKSPTKRDSTVPFPAAQGSREPGHHQSSSTDRRRGQML
ncbi:hypothetical protein ACEPAF_3693 [Sanghuangporus sanghuang]